MPVLSSAAGQVIAERTVEISARMSMAFAAAIGAVEEIYLDDAREGGIVAPPPFCVCLEWPIMFDPHCRTLTGTSDEEAWGGLHVLQDSTFHRPIRPGDRLRTVGRITHVRGTRAGALTVTKLTTTDAHSGKPVVTSWLHTIFKGLYVDGGDRPGETGAALKKLEAPASRADRREQIHLPRTLPHAYTECTGIWNPIHTERKVAQRKGLPDIIVHGTCTWAIAAMQTIRYAGGDPNRLQRFAARFEAMVIPGTDIVIDLTRDPANADTIQVAVENAGGQIAMADGIAEFSAEYSLSQGSLSPTSRT